ncbi:SusC/RagA family TonB-linked outer membrane protein [Pedobacter nyackensis]|uniref:TonB-linked outer membrane protein, SusC/RagA family n=1 Tax=Pedobacter nyackensis TaxID=475255 RepID=A0A1W2DL17_9SPHI|nr:SusC/RagA family TonB-linked outer membrane protein [Pedobacter nyackensis]SMC98113.1 TonB-linked outer membrane protein, SusC/RagA family [Pedobacter nyackensis]
MKKNNYLKWDVLMQYTHKILFLMQLTTVMILAPGFQLSAADGSFVKPPMGYDLAWYENRLTFDMPLAAKSEDVSINEVLKNSLFFLGIEVRGRVVGEDNQPLLGATVKVKGGTNSTSTNANGEFSLQNVDENATLVISFIGYNTKEIKATENLGNIQLTQNTDNLKEVEINAGYYKVKDRERTGSISKITSKDIEKQPVNNVLAAMQANIPGLQVTQNTGVPGGGFTVQVRGRNSITQGNNPFYVIDGVPFTATAITPNIGATGSQIIPNANPLASISPNDIASIEVLKDADATAIYGSRGANGVILITTKKGAIGKAQTSVSFTQGVSRVGRKLDLMDTDQYLEMRREAYFTNDRLTTTSTQYATEYDINGTWDQKKDTDWQKELIGGTAQTTNFLTSLSGGTENLQYQIGSNYYKEGTVYPGEHSFSRIVGNSSLRYNSSNKKFNASFSANYSNTITDLFNDDIVRYIYLSPNFPALQNSDGSLNWENKTMGVNPFAITMTPFNVRNNNLISNALLSYNLTPGLKISTSLGYTTMSSKNFSSRPFSVQNPAAAAARSAGFGANSIDTWIVEPQVNWTKQLGKGKFELLLGTTFQENTTDGQNITATGYTNDALLENIGSASTLTVSSRQYLQYRYTAVFGRINYAFNGKYILNMTGRRDGSTRFGSENRFANFGAIGAAWVFSEEKFIKQIPIISFAKLRGSYGITGSDQIGDYGYLPMWGSQTGLSASYQGASAITPSGLANPDYAWEINKKLEAALELGILNDKISLSTGYYSNRSSNQLVNRQLAPTTGFNTIRDNLPATVLNSGWEFELNTKNINRNGFQWSSSFNLTIPKNKLVSYPGLSTSGGDATRYVEGYPLDIRKIFNTYLDTSTGLYNREDYDGNGIFDSRDQYVIKFNGRKFYGGLQNNLSYKGFEFDILFQFVKQQGLTGLPPNTPGSFLNFSSVNKPVELLNRWQNPGDNAKYQKYGTTTQVLITNIEATSSGSLSFEDASFIKVKNVSLTYNLPSKLLTRIKISRAKFFVQGQNVLTFTKYLGLDPEIQNTNFLPQLRVILIGTQLTF